MRRVGLALGGGGARGWAHVGVLNALEEAGISGDLVVGTSMGSLVGTAYATGGLTTLMDVAQRLDWRKALYYFFEVKVPRSGLVDGTKVARFVRQYVAKADIEALPIPCATVATDVLTGAEVVIRRGDAVEAVRASISVPGIFTPVARGGAALVDGGLVNPVPVSIARDMGADFVIAVDLNHGAPGKGLSARAEALWDNFERRVETLTAERGTSGNRLLEAVNKKIRGLNPSLLAPAKRWLLGSGLPNIFDVLGNTIHIIEAQITQARLKVEPPDLLIRPAVADVSFMEFHRAKEAMQAGYAAAREQLDRLPRHTVRRIQRKD